MPSVISVLNRESREAIDNRVLVARTRGRSRSEIIDGTPVEAVGSLGTLFSTPLAPTYPLTLSRRALDFDIVVHHAPFPLADLSVSRLSNHIGVVVFWHADLISYSQLRWLVTPPIKRSLDRADRIIVADQTTINNSQFLQPYRAKCVVIPYGIDVDYWSSCTTEESIKAEILRKRHPRLILALGRLVPYKGFAVLIEALKGIEGELILIGEGGLRNVLERMAIEFGVSDRVSFLGSLSDAEVKSYLHAAHVLAFPSVTQAEAFGLVQLQAMAAELPIVNTALPTAVPKIARHDLEALTVAPNDPGLLAAALNQILADPSLARRLGQSGKSRVRELYDQENFMRRVKSIYLEILGQR
ncbi:rhamnosyl/mannosyltransferase [Bradyrhizobium sp. USDA 4532]|uniref:glycosyltransferase n=1 Tax=unclassified Bradyrhizobium TaxID=2631580 RepID=UPI0020A19BA3|nr:MULTISPECIES: glycosyltransferase [unclassified Bradyrhizobium]MCP1831679.1 rhamnosyl/mannosyltransferase [Bradyrhizobium sp. USDA 4545]MCP1916516.1 rhamnosyl/mannosyltransferase [Bradyrhizobium sp. USDA 4532]